MTPSPALTGRRCSASIAVGLLLLGCGSPRPRTAEPTASARFTYQPYSASYEGVWQGRVEQDLNNRTTVNDFGLRYYLRVELSDVAGRDEITVILDSVTPAAAEGVLPPAAATGSLRDVYFTGSVSPRGRIDDLETDSEAAFAQELAGRLLERFFPVLPESGVEPGTRWVDSVEVTYPVSGVSTSVDIVAEYEALSWTTIGERQALEIQSVSTYSFSGEGSQFGEEFTIDGTGARSARHYLAFGGAYLGFVSADTSRAEAYLTSAGIVIPIRQTRVDTLLVVP